MTTRLNRIVSLSGAAALVAVLGFSTVVHAETMKQQPNVVFVAGDAGTSDIDPMVIHHYPS